MVSAKLVKLQASVIALHCIALCVLYCIQARQHAYPLQGMQDSMRI
jgi:hypothetical protein